ncbi:hypothetical protein JTE90_018579 [Oedothorax gibbosus]|uniref:ZP domain-containing protein n=1 Tax=Oedothorax gibbosus TaxID=931172 RepID=A0AAV6U3S2_9ARAC|nr:hypothetical protein JTE90_018579 [Oedothorax gibbosus]
MTIRFVLSLVLVCSLVMCLPVLGQAENSNVFKCNVDEQFSSAFVTPVIEQNTEVTGCNARDSTSNEQEIHVLSLLRSSIHSFEMKNEYVPSISLDVRPVGKERPSTIIVLLSHSPVMWQLNLSHLQNSTNLRVIVNKPSHVVPTTKIPVSRRKLPPLNRLSSWIRSHHGPVTSFSLIPVANDITLFVGIDLSAPASICNFNSSAQSIHVKASFTQLQPATGCSVKSPSSIKNYHGTIYVIELNSNAFNSDVLIHLYHPHIGISHTNQTQNITLVLKCHAPITWVVESASISGMLHIISEHPVHIRANALETAALVEEKILPSSTAELLSTVQRSFGGFHTYVKTSKANRINVRIIDKTKYSIDDDKDSSDLSEVFFTVKQKNDSNHTQSQELPPSLQLAKDMILSCSSDKISITFALQETMNFITSLIGAHSKLSFISLLDPNCKARQNDTHITLKTNFNECGTRQVLKGGYKYHNQVQFVTTKYSPLKEPTSEEKHLPTDDDDYISEDGSGSEALSSVREERFIYSLPFHCTQTHLSRNQGNSGQKFEMKLYSKKDFQPSSLLQKFPLNVVVHDHLFAEVNVKADLRLCLVVDECWLSEESESASNPVRKSVLIKQGCPTDLSVDILTKSQCGNFSPDVDHYKMRFSFQLSEELMDQQLHLHCQLTTCAMKDAKSLNSKQCIISENFCLKQSLRPYLDSLRGKKFSMLVQGPIHVVPKPRSGKEKDILSTTETSSLPDTLVVDYSFDKLTGNTKKSPVSQELVFVGLSTEAVVGIAFASFIIGAGLMATLWLIHMYTEPSRQSKQLRKQASSQYQSGSPSALESADCADKPISGSLKPPTLQICT